MEPATETLEALQARHRKEQRDLQSRITSKKKNATKKTRKGVNDECAELERQLKEKQEQELAVLNGENIEDELEEEAEANGTVDDNAASSVVERLKNTSISGSPDSTGTAAEKEEQTPAQASQGGGKKRNRQQERMARRRAEQEAAAEAAENEVKNMTDHRAIEKTYLLKEFKANNLVEKEIQPDGHCLFSAVADQLSQRDIPLGGEKDQPPYRVVRKQATDHMERHRDDFAPFLEDDFEDYIKKIRDTAEWGGQLELKALADVYGVEIKVVQDGRTETIEPASSTPGVNPRIWLAYYRHGYGLGEHYNSLRLTS